MRKKSLQAFVLAIGLLMTLLVAAQNQLVPSSVAHSGTVLSAWAKTMPKIDGYREPRRSGRSPNGLPFTMSGEYDDAYKVDFTLTYGSEIRPGTLWVKNDYINLYLAVEIRNDEYSSSDFLYFYFDNDHDGVKETGDDCLCLLGGNSWFLDMYFKADGNANWDSQGGGTRDGAGFARYTTSTSTWVFEMVHPLNTGDDAHDFSLSIGSTVGIELAYFDNGLYSGWPTYTFTNWAQMADIVIAGPPTPPPSSSADLTITGIEVTQAVQTIDNSLPLVRGKNTAVRVYVGIGPVSVSSVTVWIYLYGVDGNGKSLGVLSGGLEAPKTPDRSVTSHTANFLLPPDWVSSSALVLKAFVKAYATTQAETNYSNNWLAEKSFTLSSRVVPKIYIVPVNLGTRTNPDIVSDEAIVKAEEYLRTVYPTSDVDFVRLPWEVLGENAPNLGDPLKEMLTHAGYDLGLQDRGITQIYGITPRGPSGSGLLGTSTPYWPTIPDLYGGFYTGAAIAACGTCIIGYDYTYATMAHEINHNLGPGVQNPTYVYRGWGLHTWGDQDFPGYNGHDPFDPPRGDSEDDDPRIREYGFDTRTMQVVDYGTPDFQSYSEASTEPVNWISPYRWQNLFDRLTPFVIGITIPHLVISGWIAKNGTGSLGPIFPVPSNQSSPSAPGSYSLVFRNSNGTVLLTHTFQPQFGDACGGGEQDPYYFVKLLPYLPGTAEVRLYADSTLLSTIQKTPHVPTVQVLSPNGGEIWNATGVYTVSWIGNDTDGGPLTFRIYYSADNGASWVPISPSIKKATYQIHTFQIDTSYLMASNQSRIKIIATDGFNTFEVLSPKFKIENHAPTADIEEPGDGFVVADIYCPLVLRGTGDDVDGPLPESAFTWTAHVMQWEWDTMFLGTGRSITWDPIWLDAIFHLTLTVTDGPGLSATHMHEICVYMFTSTVVIGNSSSQTAVGQGYTAKIRAQVNNHSPFTLSFNVTASANEIPFQTIPILNLPSGNQTNLEFLWSTAGKPKGVYNITATITLPEYEIIWLLDTIKLAIVGDITGPTARLPDGKVDVRDLAAMAKIFGVIYPNIKYDPNCDLTGPIIGVPDDKIDIRDLAAAAKNFGKIDP